MKLNFLAFVLLVLTSVDGKTAATSAISDLQKEFASATSVSQEDLLIGKSWNCTYYSADPLYPDKTSFNENYLIFANLVNSQIEQVGPGLAKQYTFTGEGLVSYFRVDKWKYDYLSTIRKLGDVLIAELALNPSVDYRQELSAVNKKFFLWSFWKCSPAAQ